MHYGISVPIFDHYAGVHVLAGLARDAEEAGWDGFFIWDHMATPWPVKIADTLAKFLTIRPLHSQIYTHPWWCL